MTVWSGFCAKTGIREKRATKTIRTDKRSVFRQIVDIAVAQSSATRFAILQQNPASLYGHNVQAEMFSLNFIPAQYHSRSLTPAKSRYRPSAPNVRLMRLAGVQLRYLAMDLVLCPENNVKMSSVFTG
jgi:hypothetical protein